MNAHKILQLAPEGTTLADLDEARLDIELRKRAKAALNACLDLWKPVDELADGESFVAGKVCRDASVHKATFRAAHEAYVTAAAAVDEALAELACRTRRPAPRVPQPPPPKPQEKHSGTPVCAVIEQLDLL